MDRLCDSVKQRSYYRSRDLSNVTKIVVATSCTYLPTTSSRERAKPKKFQPKQHFFLQKVNRNALSPSEGGRLCSSWRRRIRGGGGSYQGKLRNISQAAHQTVGTLSVVHVSTSAEGNVTPPPNVRIFCPLVSRMLHAIEQVIKPVCNGAVRSCY